MKMLPHCLSAIKQGNRARVAVPLVILLVVSIISSMAAPAGASLVGSETGTDALHGRRLLSMRKLQYVNRCPWGPYLSRGHYQWGGRGEIYCPGQGSCVGKECFINSWMAMDQGPVTSARVNQLYFYAWQPFNYACP